MERLHAKGYISKPVGQPKSVVFTEEGLQASGRQFEGAFRHNKPLAFGCSCWLGSLRFFVHARFACGGFGFGLLCVTRIHHGQHRR